MNQLIDKLPLGLLCMLSLCMSSSFTVPVAVILLALSVSAIAQLFPKSKITRFLLMFTAFSCCIEPIVLCILPLLLYDALQLKKVWLIFPAAIGIFQVDRLYYVQFILIAIGCVTAVVIYSRTAFLEHSIEKLISLRDQTVEKNLRLASQNSRLTEMQDNEIRLATMNERNRIARDIHDNVGHMLTRALLQAGALNVINHDDSMREPLNDLKHTLDTAMSSMRESVHTLHDDSIDLQKAIRDCISTVDKRFDVSLDYDMDDRVPGEIKLCIAGIIKEGLSNAVKHSNGDKIKIILRSHPAFYQLVLEDNGSCKKIAETGIGLSNMKDRVDGIGGQISFTPSKSGFRIFMSVPKERL
ncbi:MAG: sensor histidine kinase [Oscillospiraceae bacterium]|nr:sensor histidine kinase [Oscillospiraceae bacterium]